MPRRVFVRMPGEPKPTYFDVERSVLACIFCRQIRRRVDLTRRGHAKMASFVELRCEREVW